MNYRYKQMERKKHYSKTDDGVKRHKIRKRRRNGG